jgi:hypothetical protein
MKTTFENKCKILGDFSVAYKDDEQWQNFIQYNNMGLPLAFMLSLGMIEPKKHAYEVIDETWKLFLDLLGVEDEGYEDLEDLIPVGEEYL